MMITIRKLKLLKIFMATNIIVLLDQSTRTLVHELVVVVWPLWSTKDIFLPQELMTLLSQKMLKLFGSKLSPTNNLKLKSS